MARRTIIVALILVGVLVACGKQVTDPRPTFEPTATFDFSLRVSADERVTVIDEQPANTQIPPTATPLPTTETPADEPETTEETPEEETFDLGDPAIGAQLFQVVRDPSTGQMCITCHNPDEAVPGTGPYLYGIANRAGERVEGLSAVDYLRQSILEPNAHLVEEQSGVVFAQGVMPQGWDVVLGEDEINHIIAYLLTLNQTE